MAKNIISVILTGEAKGVVEASAEARKALGEVETKGQSTGSKLAGFGKAAASGIAAVAVAAGAYAVHEGAELQESTDKLAVALKNSGGNFEKQKAQIDATDKASEKFGYTYAQTNSVLAQGVIATGSLSKAQKELALAQNIAAETGKPLSAVMLAVEKGAEGQTKPLKALGIDLPVVAGGSLKVKNAQDAITKAQKAYLGVQAMVHAGLLKGPAAYIALKNAQDKVGAAQHQYNLVAQSGGDITDALSKKFAGAASASAETFQGKINAAKAQLSDTAAQIGLKLIPILEALASFVVTTLIPGIEMIVSWVQTRGIPALKSFGATVVDLYVKYVKPTVDGVVAYFRGLFQAISGVVQLFSDLFHGKFGAIWNDLKTIVSGVVDSAIGFFKAFPGRIIALIPGIASAAGRAGLALADGILHGITGAAGDVANFAKSIINGLIGYINRDVIDKLDSAIGAVHLSFFGHKIGLPSHIIPDIPTLHTGGIFNSGVGEGLAVLQDGERVLSRAQTARYDSAASHGDTYVTVHVNGANPDAVVAAIDRYSRRTGRSF